MKDNDCPTISYPQLVFLILSRVSLVVTHET
jgi:hypothetical protein